jgi:hypothetical protein
MFKFSAKVLNLLDTEIEALFFRTNNFNYLEFDVLSMIKKTLISSKTSLPCDIP